jgi:hypothetical protein
MLIFYESELGEMELVALQKIAKETFLMNDEQIAAAIVRKPASGFLGKLKRVFDMSTKSQRLADAMLSVANAKAYAKSAVDVLVKNALIGSIIAAYTADMNKLYKVNKHGKWFVKERPEHRVADSGVRYYEEDSRNDPTGSKRRAAEAEIKANEKMRSARTCADQHGIQAEIVEILGEAACAALSQFRVEHGAQFLWEQQGSTGMVTVGGKAFPNVQMQGDVHKVLTLGQVKQFALAYFRVAGMDGFRLFYQDLYLDNFKKETKQQRRVRQDLEDANYKNEFKSETQAQRDQRFRDQAVEYEDARGGLLGAAFVRTAEQDWPQSGAETDFDNALQKLVAEKIISDVTTATKLLDAAGSCDIVQLSSIENIAAVSGKSKILNMVLHLLSDVSVAQIRQIFFSTSPFEHIMCRLCMQYSAEHDNSNCVYGPTTTDRGLNGKCLHVDKVTDTFVVDKKNLYANNDAQCPQVGPLEDDSAVGAV